MKTQTNKKPLTIKYLIDEYVEIRKEKEKKLQEAEN